MPEEVEMNKRFIPLASDLMEQNNKQKLIDLYLPIFDKHKIVQSAKPLKDSENYFFILSGGTENKFLEMFNEVKGQQPINLIAIGINNSFPAALEILAYVYQQGLEGTIHYLKNERDFDALKN